MPAAEKAKANDNDIVLVCVCVGGGASKLHKINRPFLHFFKCTLVKKTQQKMRIKNSLMQTACSDQSIINMFATSQNSAC